MATEALLIEEKDTSLSADLSEFSCIEFRIHSMGTIYLSRLWRTTEGETCFLVKEGSAVLAHLAAGEEISARFLNGRFGGAPVQQQARIQEIRRETQGRFRGHHLITLSVCGGNSTATH